jgi:HlyD family secretion protein
MSQIDKAKAPKAQINQQLLWVAAILVALLLSLLVISANVRLAGAVIAEGLVSVQSSVKKVQHPTGGVVSEIRVKDGDRVAAGQVLLALDATAPGANVAIVSDAVDELTAKEARLEAERDSRARLIFPPMGASSAAKRARSDEARLFEIHLTAREGERAQLRQRIVQLTEQVRSYSEGEKSKTRQIELINSELVGVRQLFKQDLVPISRLNALEREAAQLSGDIAQLGASTAEARGKMSETELQIIQVDKAARAEAGNQLGDVQAQLAQLQQKRVTAQQEFKRVEIRAPQDGVVDHMTIHTVGGVISPGESLMIIVPDRETLHVEAHIRPTDVDHVRVGQSAMLRFSAFDQRTTPEIKGVVTHVSAEAQTEEKTGSSFYVVDLSMPAVQLVREKMKLVPGMPVETFIETDTRTILSYILKPLADQLKRAFREG